MLDSEKFAIAAHLHVVMRRVHGRVTDVEWMMKSPEYAREIIRVARAETNPDLLRLADKLEAALALPAAPKPLLSGFGQPAFVKAGPGDNKGFGVSDFSSTLGSSAGSLASGAPSDARKRYVGTLR